MNKKVGILTLSASDNCGSLLQTYALKTYIEKYMGFYAEVINFKSEQSKRLYDIFPKNIWFHPRGLWQRLTHYGALAGQKKDYKHFREVYLKMGKNVYHTEDELKKLDGKYSTIICGSDQVWNVRMSDFDNAFFLEWVRKSRKVAYASSLGGGTLVEKYSPEKLKRIFSSFSGISVREEAGKNQVEAFTGKEIDMVLDPTLLLSEEEWNEIVDAPMVEGKYIFFYSWAYCDEEINKIISEYAKKVGLDVYVINASKWTMKDPQKYSFKLFPMSGPETFLNLMKYADKVFVQSFHGVIFANIFKKDFYFMDEHRDNTLDPRLDSILTILDKKDRVARNAKDIGQFEAIDYSGENKLLGNLKTISEAFLEKNIV